ncbi:MAG: penicillin-binding protein [Chloroflexi bacterium]|nr:penicillin-binding protein [Chloroflexota bacterium]
MLNARRRRLRRAAWVVAISLLIAAGGVGLWALGDLPSLDDLEAGLALPSTRIYDRHGRLLYEILPPEQGRNRVLPLSEIPGHCRNAVIATEDANFYRHPGVDPLGIARALWLNLRGGKIVAGGSTITQQTARLLLLDPQRQAERSLRRKFREMALALQLQGRFSKDEILALYLNQVYFGNVAYGIDAAARAYFQKVARDLSLAECALLAGIAQNAIYNDPLVQPERAKSRQAVALRLMARQGYISEDEARSALLDELQFAAAPFPIEAPHFVMEVWRVLERDFAAALREGGLEVVTTVDRDWTRQAQDIVRRQLRALNRPANGARPANANNAALVALDPRSGEILTLLGSPDYFNDAIAGAVNAALAYRQPGSALKPFTYAEAMNPAYSDAYTAATMILDIRRPFVTNRNESFVPANYGHVEHGPVLVREALASSYNIPAVATLEHIGLERFLRFASDLGLDNLRDNARVDLSITLGGGEVRLLDLAEAYAALANGGYDIEPQLILSITNARGEQVYRYDAPPLTRRLMDERVAFIITDILSDNSARVPAFGPNSPLNVGFPAAAKTGTTTDYRDNWVLGYTPELVVGVWVGNADNAPMRDVSGVSGAGPIYNLFLRAVTRGGKQAEFAEPPGITRLEVCRVSGMLPGEYCPQRVEELFISGTEPRAQDSFYRPAVVDRRTGGLATASTAAADRRERVLLVLPDVARRWAIERGIPQLLPLGRDPAEDDRGALRISAPDPYTLYQLSRRLPAAAQRLRLAALAPPAARSMRFLLNGVDVGGAEGAPWQTWWTQETGQFTLVALATLADGRQLRSRPIEFSVVEEQALPPLDQGR